jgi:hypothetical protein
MKQICTIKGKVPVYTKLSEVCHDGEINCKSYKEKMASARNRIAHLLSTR